jgi:alkylation response protein AidB-like acyl-CoA dehydrogenase
MGLGEHDRVAIDQLARRFADESLAPSKLEDDSYPFRPWNRAAWTQAAELGLPGLALPAELGGTEQGIEAFGRTLSALARREAGHAAVLFTQALTRALVAAGQAGGDVLRDVVLRGEADERLLAFPIYDDLEEPPGVRANLDGDHMVLDGALAQVACLPIADACLVPVWLPNAARALCLVDLRASGVQVSEPVVTLGLRACPTADLDLSGVRVSAARCVTGVPTNRTLQVVERFRPALVALSLGVLRASFDLAFDYARERKQAKRRIVEHHMVQEMLSGIASVLDVGELALEQAYRVAESPQAQGTALLSLQEVITTWVSRAATDGVQLLGGNGYMHDYGQEKHMRDAKQLQAVFGSSATRRLRVLERRLASQS